MGNVHGFWGLSCQHVGGVVADGAGGDNYHPSAAVYGTKVTLTAKVTASISGSPAGAVDFYDGLQLLGSAALNSSGVAAYSTSNLAVGVHSLKVIYTGESSYSASTSAAQSESISKAVSAIALKTSAKTSSFDASVTLTATVTSADGTPIGTVIFLSNKIVLGEGTLVGGVVTLSTKALAVGSDSITASYGESVDFDGARSAPIPVDVISATTSTTLTSSTNPAILGVFVSFTAKVASSAGLSAGTVTFKDGATTIGSATLVSDEAVLSVKSLAVGLHSITATYVASADYSTSTSERLEQTVKP